MGGFLGGDKNSQRRISGIVRLNLRCCLSPSPFWDPGAQKPVLSGLDRTSKDDEGGSTTEKF